MHISTLALFILWNIQNAVTYSSISQLKCYEYGKAVYTYEMPPILMRKVVPKKVSRCGIVSVPLIIGGVEAKEKEFPHMVQIGYGKEPKYMCGGSLISEIYVLTAAHCSATTSVGKPSTIRLGAIDVSSTSDVDNIQIRKVAKIIIHPKFKRPSVYFDIALMEMDKPVTFTAYVRPACLNTNEQILDRNPIASGFGKTNFRGTEGSTRLMKVNIPLLSNEVCQPYFKSSLKLDDTMLCAAELKGGKDACNGDSGGPYQVVLKEPYCMYSIIGVTSFGRGCGSANSPAIYTNVYRFVPWIERVVWVNHVTPN